MENSGRKMKLVEMIHRLRTAVIRVSMATNLSLSRGPYSVLERPSPPKLYVHLKLTLFVHLEMAK